jgi:hypothetical protein
MRPNLGFLVTAMLVSACSGAHEPHRVRAALATVAMVPDSASVDVPSLLSLSIDEVGRRVGPMLRVPDGFIDPTLAPKVLGHEPLDSSALFRRRGVAIVAAYDYQTRKLSDLLLLGTNESELMRRARLRLGAPHYLVLPVFQERHPTELMGLRVVDTASNQ